MLSIFTALAINAITNPHPRIYTPLSSMADSDNDGIPDDWETNGHGPLPAGVCNPRKADLIMIICPIPGVSHADVQASIDGAKAFWARVPGRNPDGTTGVHLVTFWGNTLSAADAALPYPSIYGRGFPAAWRGLAHGIVSGAGPGGGQTCQSDWSTVANDWKVWVHEVGHQLGLEHQPKGFTTFSPVYGSLMNYDYSYSFNGSGDSIQFSRGQFASLRLRETALSEAVNLPMSEVSFLTQEPYKFTMQSKGPRLTWIDWNRNGSFGEPNVKADINDGSSVHIGETTKLAMCAGSPSFVNLGGAPGLALMYPEVSRTPATGYAGTTLSHEQKGKISFVQTSASGWTAPRTMVIADVCGEFSAVTAFDRIMVAFPSTLGVSFEAMSIPTATSPPVRRGFTLNTTSTKVVPTLGFDQPHHVWAFLWNSETKGITCRRVDYVGGRLTLGPAKVLKSGLGATATPMTSQVPVGITYNPRTSRMMMVSTETQGDLANRLKVTPIGRLGDEELYGQPSNFVGTWDERTVARPSVVCDEMGLLRIYVKFVCDPALPNSIMLCRQTADRSVNGGWRSRLMVDVWNTTYSGPAAINYNGNIAFAFRWFGNPVAGVTDDNRLHAYTNASGIDSDVYGDFDDVTHIFTHGLKDSLAAVPL